MYIRYVLYSGQLPDRRPDTVASGAIRPASLGLPADGLVFWVQDGTSRFALLPHQQPA